MSKLTVPMVSWLGMPIASVTSAHWCPVDCVHYFVLLCVSQQGFECRVIITYICKMGENIKKNVKKDGWMDRYCINHEENK